MHKFNQTILRAYDIRGVFGKTLFAQDAYYAGRAFATICEQRQGGRKICVGYDGRVSSPELKDELIRGLLDAGAVVHLIGCGPSPMLYYSVERLNADGGIMVTGSHNPKDHNGFKMKLREAVLFGKDIEEIGKIASEGTYLNGKGEFYEDDITDDYVAYLYSKLTAIKKELKIAWDTGNGAAGEVLQKLVTKLKGQHFLINADIDGNFPHHHPDPSVPENMVQLQQLTLKEGCDAGFAFDGDADRLGVVDNRGRILSGDQLMIIFSRHILKENPGAKIIAEVKASQLLFDDIEEKGGVPLIWKTGHSYIKAKMREEKALFAGEISGHIFFAENHYFDDGIYAAVKFINILDNIKTLSTEVDALPKSIATPEIRVEVDEARKFVIVDMVKDYLTEQGIEFSDVDGVRVKEKEGWWLLRASNTGPLIGVRCEAVSKKALARIYTELALIMKKFGVVLPEYKI